MTIDFGNFLSLSLGNLLPPTFDKKHGRFETISVGSIQTIVVSKHRQEPLEDFEYFAEWWCNRRKGKFINIWPDCVSLFCLDRIYFECRVYFLCGSCQGWWTQRKCCVPMHDEAILAPTFSDLRNTHPIWWTSIEQCLLFDENYFSCQHNSNNWIVLLS